ncbi:YihY/virulence factor BrkB family protein [Metamycoplasma neophronis]|uniref:YihY/virulence factor BrkB family protein n=1 Tax=Metamycoplasma neophronis TaxID=872983 RepID=A0ABY2Z186_9BACT|nr:YihY/virulence factor BrkB family protein [Metamycoplasma neophronis]TPR54309.1 YihY/virulence factor BrkB family protein [Metamycoplasma neophronis]
MWKKKPNKLKTGWQAQDNKNNEENKPQTKTNNLNVSSNQIVKNKTNKNLFERVIKWIIYAILFIAIPRYLRSSRIKGKEIVNSAYEKLNSHEFAFVPAGYAMYLFLSFIPITCLLLGVIGSISAKYEVVLEHVMLGQIIPGISQVIPSISSLWSSAGGAIAFALFALSVIWLASKGYSKFIYSIDALYGHKSPYRMWKTRIKGFIVSIIISFGLALALLGFSAFMTFLIENAGLGEFAEDLSKMTLADFHLQWEFYLIYWVTIILFLPVLTYLAFLLFFTFAPNFKLKFSQAHPGALIASIPTSVFILIFGSLASLIPYQKFGIVASFMYVILLLSVMSYFIYAGVIVNSSFYHTFVNMPTIEKRSWWKRKKVTV